MSADGTWTLEVTNSDTSAAATLDTWALSLPPAITVTPVSPQTVTVRGVQETVASTFLIGFPQQQLSGTYTIQFGPDIQDQFGDQTDVGLSAGLNVLRGVDQNGPTTTVVYQAADGPKTIVPSTQFDQATNQPIPGTSSSSIVVPDSFIIAGDTTAAGQSVMQVQLNITYPNDPDLTVTLAHYSPSGTFLGQVTLLSNVGQGTQTANFNNTVLDDNAATPIQNGAAPFFATFDPQESLATVFAPTTGGQQGMDVQGTWTLTVSNSGTGASSTGSINGWSLTFEKPEPTSGLGVLGTGPTSHLPAVEPGPVEFPVEPVLDARRRRLQHLRERPGQRDRRGSPSDPTGNTVYVGGASGGVWKTSNFLTTAAGGPTWMPLTNFGPNAALNVSDIKVFSRNSNPNDSIIIVGTGGDSSGQQSTAAPGVGFLISNDGGTTWNVYDSTVNVSGSYTQTAAAATSCRSTPRPATAPSSATSSTRSPSIPSSPPAGR